MNLCTSTNRMSCIPFKDLPSLFPSNQSLPTLSMCNTSIAMIPFWYIWIICDWWWRSVDCCTLHSATKCVNFVEVTAMDFMSWHPSIAQQEFSWIRIHKFTLPIRLIIVWEELTGMEWWLTWLEQWVGMDMQVMWNLIFTRIHMLDHGRRNNGSNHFQMLTMTWL